LAVGGGFGHPHGPVGVGRHHPHGPWGWIGHPNGQINFFLKKIVWSLGVVNPSPRAKPPQERLVWCGRSYSQAKWWPLATPKGHIKKPKQKYYFIFYFFLNIKKYFIIF
jgi:hypothetical protein